MGVGTLQLPHMEVGSLLEGPKNWVIAAYGGGHPAGLNN